MELSLLTFSMISDRILRRLDANQLCEIAQKNKLSMLDLMDVELSMYGEKELKAAMDQAGLKCGCIISTVSLYTAPHRAEARFAKALERAKAMGAPYLMVVPGQASELEKCLTTNKTRQQLLDKAVRFFTMAVNKADSCGITVCLEDTPHWYKPLCSAEDCLYLMEHVEGLKLVFDTGNVLIADPHADPLAFYEKLKPYIVRVHLKDVVIGRFKTGEECADHRRIRTVTTGSGVIPIHEIIQRLKADGYTGDLAVEYAAWKQDHGLDHAEALRPYCDYVRRSLEGKKVQAPQARIEGLRIPASRLFFGTAIKPMQTGKQVHPLLDSMFALGINAYDCARGYGLAEKSLGDWIRDRSNRDKIVLLTKCGNVSMGGKVRVNRAVIEKELDKSLKTLGTNYIDIYLLHRDDPNTPVAEIIDCLNEQLRLGKIRIFGASNWSHERIGEANRYAASRGLRGFSVASPNFGLAEQVNDPWGGGCVTISGNANAEARAWYGQNQMPVIAYSSLGRGFFSGRFKSGDWDGARTVLDKAAQKGYLYQVNMDRLKRAEILAEQKKCSVSEIAMRYVFGNRMNMFGIVSTSKQSRMLQNIRAAENPLTEDEVSFLENG